jgi:cytochrome c556
MTRERFNWILTGLIVGIALAMLGVTNGFGADLPAGQALVDHRVAALKKAGGSMQFFAQYDGSDAAAAVAAAKVLDDTAAALLSWFPEGSGPGGAGVEKTRALPVIWTDFADFEAKAKAFDDAVGPMTAAAAANDVAAIQAALAGVGKSCKACHETYRGPEEDE